MGNRNYDRKMRKLLKRIRRYYFPLISPLYHRDLRLDQEEIEMYRLMRLFRWLVNQVKKNLYRRPQYVVEPEKGQRRSRKKVLPL